LKADAVSTTDLQEWLVMMKVITTTPFPKKIHNQKQKNKTTTSEPLDEQNAVR
jgi:hypothetical protein